MTEGTALTVEADALAVEVAAGFSLSGVQELTIRALFALVLHPELA